MLSIGLKVLPLTSATLILLSQYTPAIAASTWMPEFDPDQSVYIDPALSDHPIAPFQFSPKLETQLAQESKEGLRYFVVAAQQGNEPIPSGKPLGVAKVDELLSIWNNRPGFPRENYVVIFWVRQRVSVHKGSVGVNAGKVGREAGVLPALLSSPTGLVIPALKANMPADPEGAMIDIVTNIENQVTSYRETQVRRQQTAKARQEQERVAAQEREQFNQNLQSWWQTFVNALPFVGGMSGIGFILMTGRRRKAKAHKLINEWSTLCQNTSNLYLEVENNELPKLQALPLDIDEKLKTKFDRLVNRLAEFMAWSSVASELVTQAQALLNKGKSRQAIHTLTKDSVTIENSNVPVMLTSLGGGIDVAQTLMTAELNSGLNYKSQSIKSALGELLSIQQSYLELSQTGAFTTLLKHPGEILDEHIPELNRYGLHQGAFVNSSHGFENWVSEYEQLIQQTELEFTSSQIVNSVETHKKAIEMLDRLASRIQKAVMDKRKCEKVTPQSFSGKKLADKIAQASTALEQVKTHFPHEPYLRYEANTEKALAVKNEQFPQNHSQFIQAYQQKHFGEALKQLQQARTLEKDWMMTLARIVDYPVRLQEKKRMLERQLENIQRRNQALQSRHQVELGSLAWNSSSLNSLESRIDALEYSVSRAENEQQRESSSSSSLWSDDSSWNSSSGSDFSSFSGSDYGSSGSDYGSGSGGGDY